MTHCRSPRITSFSVGHQLMYDLAYFWTKQSLFLNRGKTRSFSHNNFGIVSSVSIFQKGKLRLSGTRPSNNLAVDDLVWVLEDDTLQGLWPLAKILEVHPVSDGTFISVTLQTPHGKKYWPVIKLSKVFPKEWFPLASSTFFSLSTSHYTQLPIIAKTLLFISLPWLLYPVFIVQKLFQPCLPRYLHYSEHIGHFVIFWFFDLLYSQMGRD